MVYYVLALAAIVMVAGAFGLLGPSGASAPVALILCAFFLVTAFLSLLVGLTRK